MLNRMPTAKRLASRDALDALLSDLPQREQWQNWWREFEERTSLEGRLVHDADRLEMLLQAYVYEQTTGNRWLKEFWEETSRASFEFEASRLLFDALSQARQGTAHG